MTQTVIFSEAKEVLTQLMDTIGQLNADVYTQKIPLLGDSSIGEHTRHIIELFQQLNDGYQSGTVDYDQRKRDVRIQREIDVALECTAHLIAQLEKPDKRLLLSTVYNSHETELETNYLRELMYNVEHCIHHQAIIKVALLYLGSAHVDENFGVAKSTLIYKKACAQ